MHRRALLALPLLSLARPASAQATAPKATAPPTPTGHAATGTTASSAAATTAPALGVGPRPLVFPADFGAHPDTRIEWWYATGALSVDGRPDGPHYGFQLTFFRSRTEVPAAHPSRFAASQLVFAHAALSDLAARRLRHDQRVARAGFGIAEAATGDTRVRLRDWQFDRQGSAGQSRYSARLSSDSAGFGFALQLAATQPLLLQGEAGWSRKGPQPAQASHYYSQPHLAVDGQLRVDGRALAVRGQAWLDHEWSNSLLAPEAVGWDWAGINLDDGGALTVFRLRRADGTAVYAGGSFRPAGGAVRAFGPGEVTMSAGRRWTSPHSQASYPVAWTIETPAGRFLLDAAFDDQELDSRSSTGAIYWEGLSRLRDADGRLRGTGYLEMTGYAGRLTL